MKLITEEVSQVKFITEKYKGKKRLCIEGVFLQGGIKNRNGRMYPVDILEKEVNRYCNFCESRKSTWRTWTSRRSDCKS